jgi:hypothetical protein
MTLLTARSVAVSCVRILVWWRFLKRRKTMKRAEILEAARVCVCGERQQDYVTPENNFETIGLLWGVYLRASHPELAKVMAINHINAKDVATMMGLLKVARIATGYKEDNFVDLAGYAACAGEIAAAERGGGDHE